MSSAADDIDDISALTPAIDNGDDEQLSLIQKNITKPLSEFVNCSQAFLKGCDRPSYTVFLNHAYLVGIGFLAMGFISFIVKIFHIPVTKVILGQS